MRVTRLQVSNYRGFADLDLRPGPHVLLCGVPRAGRSDIIGALARVLDPELVRTQPVRSDLRQYWQAGAPESPGGDPAGDVDGPAALPVNTLTRASNAHIEVTLADLDPDVEQELEGHLEPLGEAGAADAAADPAALGWCVRIAYDLHFDPLDESLTQVTYFPRGSDPDIGDYRKVSNTVRGMLPVISLRGDRPLQLRPDGRFRSILDGRDPVAAADALTRFRDSVAEATSQLSLDPAVSEAVTAVLDTGGVRFRLGAEFSADAVSFQSEDGSLPALLRGVQPALDLDGGGFLPLTSHGSTSTAVLAAAEAMYRAVVPGAVVLADDFDDRFDAATSEHLANVLRREAGQLWLTTRRPDAARAFPPQELVRLSVRDGDRTQHVVPAATDRRSAAVLRQLHRQLLPGFTSPVLAIVEGPHDLASYMAVDRVVEPPGLPLSAGGIRLISADGAEGGGTGEIPKLATLARSLGFRVVGVVDHDSATREAGADLDALLAACDVVVRLPDGMSVERAIVAMQAPPTLRAAASEAFPAFGRDDPTLGVEDDQVAEELVKPLKKNMHEPFIAALMAQGARLAVVEAVLATIKAGGDPRYSGPQLVDVPAPTATPGAP